MAKVVWTEQAYDDLEAIFEYISHDSVKYAQLLIEKILINSVMNDVIASGAKQSLLGPSSSLRARRDCFAVLAMTLVFLIISTMTPLSEKMTE